MALVFMWLLGVAPALILWAWGGPGGLLRTPALAWDYVAAFHAVPLVAIGSSQGLLLFSPTGSLRFIFFLCPMLGTMAALALCFHAGRWLARATMARVEARTSWVVLASALRIAIVYGLVFLGVSALAKLSFSYGEGPAGGSVVLHPVVSHAFLAPFLISFAGALAGAYTTVRRRADGALRIGGACLTGGAAALAAGIALGVVGWAVLAVARPDGTATYARWLAARGTVGASAILTNQALALPNHGMLVLAPAMGACDQGSTIGGHGDLVCLRHFEFLAPNAFTNRPPFPSPTATQHPAPAWFLAFLLVPAASCLIGGAMAVREFGRSRAAVGAGSAALLGAGAGGAFAVLCSIAAMLATVRVDSVYGTRPVLFAIGPNPWLTGLLGLGWGVVFCTGGAVATAIRFDRRNSRPDDQSVPDRPSGPAGESLDP